MDILKLNSFPVYQEVQLHTYCPLDTGVQTNANQATRGSEIKPGMSFHIKM